MEARNKTWEQASREFDFYYGAWKVHNRRLRQRLAGCEEWEEFDATSTAHRLLRGAGNEDEFVTDFAGGFAAMSFRFLSAKTKQWSIYWVDSRHGVLEPPVIGGFDGNVGIFSGADTFDGRAILVRFTWSRVDTPNPRWEQAFSDDGGLSWETNWIMDFTRIA